MRVTASDVARMADVRLDAGRTRVVLGTVEVECDVARSSQQRVAGLTTYAALADGEGLLFPLSPPEAPREVTMHMSTVAFPIDIVFVRRGRVSRIVADLQPGDPRRFSHVASHVVEVPGGFCTHAGIRVGDPVDLD